MTASEYVQPRVGGDAVLLKGLSKAILEQGLEARAFIDAHTRGFEAFAADLQTRTWDEIERGSGLDRVLSD